MGITVDNLINELRSHLGLDTDELDSTAALLLLNRSYWDILNKFPMREKEKVATFATVIGTALYEMPTSFEALRLVSIEDINSDQHTPLNRLTSYRYEQLYSNSTDAEGSPTDYLREDTCLRFYPTPDNVYNITLRYWANLDDLIAGATEPNIPREWHEVVLFGGIWRGFLKLKDTVQASIMKTQQILLINNIVPVEAKEEGDSHESGVEIRGYNENYT